MGRGASAGQGGAGQCTPAGQGGEERRVGGRRQGGVPLADAGQRPEPPPTLCPQLKKEEAKAPACDLLPLPTRRPSPQTWTQAGHPPATCSSRWNRGAPPHIGNITAVLVEDSQGGCWRGRRFGVGRGVCRGHAAVTGHRTGPLPSARVSTRMGHPHSTPVTP